jgi:hypothetical protein
MDFTIEYVNFLNLDLGETVPTDYLLDNIGDVVTAEIGIRSDGAYIVSTSELIDDPNGLVSLVANPETTTTDGVIPNVAHLWTSDIVGFESIKEGDQITFTDLAESYSFGRTVIEKIDSQLLLLNATLSPSQFIYPKDTLVYVSTPMQSAEYFFGLIENAEPVNYLSKVDGNEQVSRTDGLSSTTLTDTELTQSGHKSYQYGSIQIKGNGIGDGPPSPEVSQAFIITHKFVINPLSLAGQITDTKNGVSPSYFKNSNSLKYALLAELSKDLTDPNRKKDVQEHTKLGNCGYLAENFNTGITNYSISNLVFTRLSGEVINDLELTTDKTTLSFDIDNTIDEPFSDGDTKFVLNHWFMPNAEEEYREPAQFSTGVNAAKDRTLKENFIFDRNVCTLGTTSTTPDNKNGTEQVFSDCLITYISNSKVRVESDIEMVTEVLSRITATSGRDYVLSIATKDHTLNRAESNKATIPIRIGTYFTDLTDPDMVTIANTFIDHPNSDVDTGVNTLTVRTEDDVVAVAKFVLNRNDITGFTRQGVEIGYSHITAQIIARKDADTFFVLDSFDRSLPSNRNKTIAPYGTVPVVGFDAGITEDRGFRTPADDLRKNIVVKRRIDLDGGGFFHYECYFPFIFRWEDWAKLDGVNDEFYDESLPNNGLNHDWARYAARTDWNIFFQFSITATKDGVALDPYVTESQLFVEDYTEGTEWDTEIMKGYLVSSGLEITEGGQSGISLDESTRIEGEMTYVTTPLPTLADLVMVLMVNVFEKGDFKAQYRISSLYPNTTTDNVWIGLAGILTATKDDSLSPRFLVKAELRPDLLEEEQEFRFSERFYDTRPDLGIPDGKTLVGGGLKTLVGGGIKQII